MDNRQNTAGGCLALLFLFGVLLLLFTCTRDDEEHAAWVAKVDRIRADVDAGRE